jgi:hypothetical protein
MMKIFVRNLSLASMFYSKMSRTKIKKQPSKADLQMIKSRTPFGAPSRYIKISELTLEATTASMLKTASLLHKEDFLAPWAVS